ncbi:hypothetical protein OSB04_005218 [Centaurea solstitialis]|uniref:AIPP2-like SPOC-like domain-containing protein n=1 Tax=Centaurea solstitialis TaxID=347529 RepID=A0AA38TN73_9ASTR|nr:hypothetical protein OSB04_005218 [Centaurea solstitialis]
MSAIGMDKPCDICGDIGVIEAIVTCCECKIFREHLYCMRIFRIEAPPFWSCEECDKKKLISPRPSVKEPSPEASSQKVASLSEINTRVTGAQSKNAFASRFNFKEQKVHTGRTKYISCEEAVKLSSFKNQSEQPSRKAFVLDRDLRNLCHHHVKGLLLKHPHKKRVPAEKPVPPLRNRDDATQSMKSCKRERTVTEREMKTAKGEVLSPRKEAADTKMQIEVPKSSKRFKATDSKSGSNNDANAETGSSGAGKPSVIRDMPVSEKNRPYVPALYASWNGSFYLPKGHESFNDVFKAHPPANVHKKVYAALKKMPESIHFELVPKHEVWMDMFPNYCPDNDDIGLYFFPRFKNRSEHSNSIMDFLWRKDLLMRSSVDGVDLLVLSSRLLQPHSQEFEGDYFLWGVFRRPNILKKAVEEGKVAEKRPLLEAKREPYDDCPPGFEKIR